MKISEENIIYIGGGTKFPALLMWDVSSNNQKLLEISHFPDGGSVYALAMSPNGNRIAAGTKAGLLRIFSLTDYRANKNASPIFEVYHPPSVLSIAFSTDDIFASAGIDGKIKFWSISKQKQLEEIDTQQKGVFALCRLGSLVMAAIGSNSKLQIWDLDSLELKFESDFFALPKIQALASVGYNSTDHLIMHPSRTGELHIYDVPSNFKKHLVKAHQGDFCAVACGNLRGQENIVTGGFEDKMLKVWSAKADKLIFETPVNDSILSIGWCGKDKIMVITADGSGQIWNLDGGLATENRFDDYDLRTSVGLSSSLLTKSVMLMRNKNRDDLLKETDNLLNELKVGYTEKTHNRLIEIAQEFNNNGFSIISTGLYADVARIEKKHIAELIIRLDLAKELKGKIPSPPNLYALADLLENLKEPELAKKYFEEILDVNQNYRNTQERIRLLELQISNKLDYSNLIRGDLNKKELIIQELEKCTVLNKNFESKAILYMLQPVNIGRQIGFENITDCFRETIKKNGIEPDKLELKEIAFFNGNNEIQKYKIDYLPSKSLDGIGYGFRIENTTGNSKLIPFAIFDASFENTSSFKEHNEQVKAIWISYLTSLEIKNWIDQMNGLAVKSIRKAIAEIKAEF